MTGEDLFRIWAPDEVAWAAWAKPVLFAHVGGVSGDGGTGGGEPATTVPPAGDLRAGDLPPMPPADGRAVVVVDLPGEAGVAAGLRLAAGGFRPVPLYNAVPPPSVPAGPARTARHPTTTTTPPVAMIDVGPILAGLVGGAASLAAMQLPPAASPAFLLDHDRRTGTAGVRLEPGVFDNRSVSLSTDFPSGHLLRSKGIDRAVVLQPRPGRPQADLCHTLLRWQRAGVAIEVQHVGSAGPPRPVTVDRSSGFGRVWQRALALLGLRRSPMGGFGGTLPEPGGGGG
jgi:hypothetical protein